MNNNKGSKLLNTNSCMKASDNKHFDCPARMADGRHFTDYRPNCHLNNNLRTNNSLVNTFEYRRFLQNRGNELMDFNRKSAYDLNGCGTCKEPYHTNTMLPEQSRLYCNKDGCKAEVVDPKGLGQGRCYGPTQGHLREKQASNCCGNSNSVFSYYGGNDPAMKYVRDAVPSGGNVPANNKKNSNIKEN